MSKLTKAWDVLNRFANTAGRPMRTRNIDHELLEALEASTEWLEAVLAAMDKYNEANGTHIIGPSLLGSARQIAHNRAAIARAKGGE